MKAREIRTARVAVQFFCVYGNDSMRESVKNVKLLKDLYVEAAGDNTGAITEYINSVKKAVEALEKKGKPYSLLKEARKVLLSAIDESAGKRDMQVAFKDMEAGQAVAFRGKLSERTGKRLFVRSTPLPIFPGDENFVKGLAKKQLKKGVFCTLKKISEISYLQSEYEILQQGDTIVAKKLQCTTLCSTSDSAYIKGCKEALSGVIFK